MNYPWTNITKKLQKSLESSKDSEAVRIDNIEEWFEEIKNRKIPWWKSAWMDVEHWWHDMTWSVYRWFKPCHRPVRDAIPRHWTDCTELILDVNFAIIKEFVENEMDNVVWDDKDRPEVMAAGKWLEDSYEYITHGRAELQDKFNEALRRSSDLPLETRKNLSYEEKYGESNVIEQEIDNKDRQVLEGLARFRQWMWT